MFSPRVPVWRYGPTLLLLACLGLINAVPSNFLPNMDEKLYLTPRAVSNGAELRILCLGASITYGWASPDGNGYRYALRSALRQAGYNVNMIGSVKSGNMNDNDVEGWPGYKIAEVASKAELSLPSMPNVVLVFVGTNDMAQDSDATEAPSRMAALIDRIFQVVPNTSVIVAKLLPNRNTAVESRIETFNQNLVNVVSQRQAGGKKITLVDMHSDWFSIADILPAPDGTHPTETGYLKMAKVFYNGIISLGAEISPPQSVTSVNDAAAKDDIGAGSALDILCEHVSGEVWGSAQSAECGVNTIPTTAGVASSAITGIAPASTPSKSGAAAPVAAIAVTSNSISPSLSSSALSLSTAISSTASTSTKLSSTTSPSSPVSSSTKASSIASSIAVSPMSSILASARSSILLSLSLASSTSASVLASTTPSSTTSNPVTLSTKSSAAVLSSVVPSTLVILVAATSSVLISSRLVSSTPVSSSSPAPATTVQSSAPASKPNSSLSSSEGKRVNMYLVTTFLLLCIPSAAFIIV